VTYVGDESVVLPQPESGTMAGEFGMPDPKPEITTVIVVPAEYMAVSVQPIVSRELDALTVKLDKVAVTDETTPANDTAEAATAVGDVDVMTETMYEPTAGLEASPTVKVRTVPAATSAVAVTKVRVSDAYAIVATVVVPKPVTVVTVGVPESAAPNEGKDTVTVVPAGIAAESVNDTVMVVPVAAGTTSDIDIETPEMTPAGTATTMSVVEEVCVTEADVATVGLYVPAAGAVATGKMKRSGVLAAMAADVVTVSVEVDEL
jgi:hypothetical protein